MQVPHNLDLMQSYLDNVLALVDSVSRAITASERDEVEHLVRHGEPAEGLRSLAFILSDGQRPIHTATFQEIARLVTGLVAPSDLPSEVSVHMSSNPGVLTVCSTGPAGTCFVQTDHSWPQAS